MKERLTGAIILVALIVLLVPELLTGPPHLRRAGPSVRALTEPAGAKPAPVHSVTLPLMMGAGTRSAASEGASSAAAQRASQPLPAPAARSAPAPAPTTPSGGAKPSAAPARDAPPPAGPNPAQFTQPKAKPAARAPVKTPRAPAKAQARPANRPASGAHWGVQLGVFAYHADALRLAHRVHARGLAVHIATLTLRGRRLWRVTAGPVKSRAAALKLARRLRSLGLKGNLRRQ